MKDSDGRQFERDLHARTHAFFLRPADECFFRAYSEHNSKSRTAVELRVQHGVRCVSQDDIALYIYFFKISLNYWFVRPLLLLFFRLAAFGLPRFTCAAICNAAKNKLNSMPAALALASR